MSSTFRHVYFDMMLCCVFHYSWLDNVSSSKSLALDTQLNSQCRLRGITTVKVKTLSSDIFTKKLKGYILNFKKRGLIKRMKCNFIFIMFYRGSWRIILQNVFITNFSLSMRNRNLQKLAKECKQRTEKKKLKNKCKNKN